MPHAPSVRTAPSAAPARRLIPRPFARLSAQPFARPFGLLAALGLVLGTGCATTPPRIDSDDFLADVTWLADDAREGRDTGSPGLLATADWIAERFREAGLEPAGDGGTYLQHFTLKGSRRLLEGNTLSVAGRALELQLEYMPLQTALTGSVRAPAVFAGYGITDPDGGRDDYAGLDVKDKAVVVLRRGPKATERGSRYGERGRGREHATFAAKVNNAFQRGAAALLIVNDPLGCPPDTREDELPSYRALPGEGVAASLPAVRVSARVGLELFASRQLDLTELQRALDAGEARGMPLEGVTVALEVRAAPADVPTVNVLGYLPGTDESLDGEHVLIGAHMDHLGRASRSGSRGGPSATGQIHNGADDNASGTAGVVLLAEELAERGGLRRGVLFAAWSGEEWGLLGSQHYTEEPTRPLDRLVAAINMDMIGRSTDRAVIVEGMGTSPGFRELVVRAHDPVRMGLELQLADKPSENSDHASFVRREIPVLNFFTGLHEDYHMPSDDAALINAVDGAAIASLAGQCVVLLAEADARPAWTAPGNGDAVAAGPADPHAAPGRGRPRDGAPVQAYRVVFGSSPDMAYQKEDGVRITGVRAGTPAEAAGLKAGDVITAFDGTPVKNLEDYSVLLFRHKPGDEITVTVRRGDETLELKAVLSGQAGEG